jgi:hypothetical protein
VGGAEVGGELVADGVERSPVISISPSGSAAAVLDPIQGPGQPLPLVTVQYHVALEEVVLDLNQKI